MTALKRAFALLISSLLIGCVLSCVSGKPPAIVLPLVIDPAALPAAVINVPYTATLTAAGGVQPYTWSLASGTLPAGLSISTGGVVSGTPTATGNTTVKFQVTDSQTPTEALATSSKTITVNQPIAITTTSLTAGSIGVAYSASLTATGGVPPYTWSITSGNLPAGLTLSTSGFISGMPTAQETQTFIVQAADSQTPASTTTATLTLTINGPTSRLNGNYVFSFSGYQNGLLVIQAGSFTADGAGNITAGLMDSNSSTGVHTKLTFTGTYSLGSANTGPMSLNIATLGTFTYQVAVPASGTIRFIQNGTAGNQGTGYIRQVTSATKVTIAQLAAFWSFGANGADVAQNRYAAAGTFQADNTGNWTNGEEDTNDNGSVSNSVTFTGSFVAIDPITGRGTATLTANSVTTNYSFYPVSSTELIMVSTDPVSATAPLALYSLLFRPLNTYTNASITIPTVTQLQGTGSSNGSSVPYGLLAFATFDGKGGLTVTTDENLGGTLSANSYTATYNIASNGRTTISGFGTSPIVFYLSTNVGFMLDGDTGVTTGTLVPQQGNSLSNSSINGSYQGATLQTVLPSVVVEDDSGAFDGAGNLALTFDTSGPGGPQQGLTQALTYNVSSAGRAPLTLNGNTVGIAYVVASTATGSGGTGKVWILSTDANAKINSLEK